MGCCSHGINREVHLTAAHASPLYTIYTCWVGGWGGGFFLPLPRTSRSSVCRKVSREGRWLYGLGAQPAEPRSWLQLGEANVRAHPHLPGEPLWLWGEEKRSGPHNGKTASLPLGSTHGLQIFVVWPVGASPGIKQLWEIEFPDPPGLSPGNVCTRVCTRPHTHVLQWRSASCKQKCSTGARSNSVCFGGCLVTAF